jgi:hypothetical protein
MGTPGLTEVLPGGCPQKTAHVFDVVVSSFLQYKPNHWQTQWHTRNAPNSATLAGVWE